MLESAYKKQQSVNLDISNDVDLLALQRALGNKGALLMLEELAKAKPKAQKNNPSGTQSGPLTDALFPQEKNEAMSNQQHIKQFKALSGENKQAAEDAVASGRFAVKHTLRNAPNLRAADFMGSFRGFLDWINVMKVYINQPEEKEIETEEADQLLKAKDKKIRNEFEMLLKMIGRLPEYTEDEAVQRDYYRVYRFMIASGVKLDDFFKRNGNLKDQRQMMIDQLDQQ